MPLPRVLHDTSVSPFYTQVKNEGNWNDFALLETPDKVSAIAEYYQTVHNHSVLGGYLSRKQVYPYDDTPGWNELRYLNFRTQAEDIISRDSLANTPLVMAYYHIKYVVLHQNYLNTREASIASEVLKETLGNAAPVYKDDELMAYRMPETVPQAGSASQLVIGLGEGWNAYQNGTRSLNGAAQLLIFNPSNSVLKVTLTTTVLAKTDHLQLTIHQSYGPTNNNKDATISNTSINLQPTKLSAELTLQPGLNTISFEPDANGKSILSFGVVQIK